MTCPRAELARTRYYEPSEFRREDEIEKRTRCRSGNHEIGRVLPVRAVGDQDHGAG